MKLLHLDSSVLGGASVSRKLSAEILGRFAAAHPGLDILRRDLVASPLPHLSQAWVEATRGPGAEAPRPEALADDFGVLDEFLASDIVVIGAPMYNFGISSQLRAWIDRILVPRKTFAYVDGAPKGLCGDKRVVVASSRGGVYSSGPYAPVDHQETYLRAVFGFIGITDLTFVRAEGLSMGPEKRAQAVEAAEAEAKQLAA